MEYLRIQDIGRRRKTSLHIPHPTPHSRPSGAVKDIEIHGFNTFSGHFWRKKTARRLGLGDMGLVGKTAFHRPAIRHPVPRHIRYFGQGFTQILRFFGQTIGDLRRHRGFIVPVHQACGLQLPQSFGQHLGRYAGDQFHQSIKALRTFVLQSPQDVECPSPRKQAQNLFDRATRCPRMLWRAGRKIKIGVAARWGPWRPLPPTVRPNKALSKVIWTVHAPMENVFSASCPKPNSRQEKRAALCVGRPS